MRLVSLTVVVLAGALALAACKPHQPSAQDAAPASPPTAEPAAADASKEAPAPAAKAFEPANLPVSSVPLGDFPYIKLPRGYAAYEVKQVDFAQVPLWTGDRLEPVEGKVWAAQVDPDDGKSGSALELERNIESVVTQLGGKQIFEGKMPKEALQKLEEWPREPGTQFTRGYGGIHNQPLKTFVIHRADRDIWVHLSANDYSAGLMVAETKPLQITAGLLPASELKSQIDATGKVALHVNFATDKTEILADSQPQIAQVVQLLKDDPSLKLAVNGYTDNTGDAGHNKTLSEGRAKAVATAITAQGIDAARLTSAGFGAAEPVAGNTSEDGKAKNRRVELVKQ